MYLHLCSQCLHLIQLLLDLVSFVQDFSVFCCYVFILQLKCKFHNSYCNFKCLLGFLLSSPPPLLSSPPPHLSSPPPLLSSPPPLLSSLPPLLSSPPPLLSSLPPLLSSLPPLLLPCSAQYLVFPVMDIANLLLTIVMLLLYLLLHQLFNPCILYLHLLSQP